MKNIKAIELTKPAFGLQTGSVLSRTSSEHPFTLKYEHVGEDYSSSGEVTVAASMVNSSFAKSVEWFEDRRSAKYVVADLQKQVKELTTELAKSRAKVTKIDSLITEKSKEYQKSMDKIQNDLDYNSLSGEDFDWIDEASTVYYNLIDLLAKLKKHLA